MIDDDRRRASATAQWLCGTGRHSSAAGDVASAIAMVRRERFDTVLVDASMRGDGRTLLAELRSLSPVLGIVAMVDRGAPASEAVAAFRNGADDVTLLPAPDGDLLAAIRKAVEAARRRGANRLDLGAEGRAEDSAHGDCGAPLLPDGVEAIVERIAASRATVLLSGESGTGKSLVARELHRRSPRRDGPFVEVACGAVCESLLESELFGHVAGAFTGATTDRIGRFLQAHGGTIFLDEIATASPAMQVKLLRVLQERQFEPLGTTETHTVDARVILASHESLAEQVASGRFREDLFWRINVVTIHLPPLRERPGHVLPLAERFLAEFTGESERRVEGFGDAAKAALLAYDWPGNVRELRHAVERAVVLGDGEWIEADDLPLGRASLRPSTRAALPTSLRESLETPEKQLILEALHRHGWCRHAAAKALGINRTSLYKKFKRLGIDPATLGRPLPQDRGCAANVR